MFTIAIIGGGFSGTMVAANLARLAGASPLRVVLIERRPCIGRGVAYSTPHQSHLLNVPAGRMSAWPDKPDHFLHWLQRHDAGLTAGSFVRRSRYGEYTEFALHEAVMDAPDSFHFERRLGEGRDIRIADDGRAEVTLDRGEAIVADRVVLAIGNQPPRDPLSKADLAQLGDRYIGDPWNDGGIERCGPPEPLLIIGTGLTMVDFAVTLRARGHRAPLFAVSRHGLLPHAHRNPPQPPVPFAKPFRVDQWDGRVLTLLRWIRTNADQTGEWREVVNSLRGDTAAIWSRLTNAERERFLRHVRSFWDAHRHRMAQEIERVVRGMIDGGALAIIAGRLGTINVESDHVFVEIHPRGFRAARTLRVARIVNCTGPECDLSRVEAPLIRQLLNSGLMVLDRHRLGVITDDRGALIDHENHPSETLFTLGGLRRNELWETTAVPEIRVQTKALAKLLLQNGLASR